MRSLLREVTGLLLACSISLVSRRGPIRPYSDATTRAVGQAKDCCASVYGTLVGKGGYASFVDHARGVADTSGRGRVGADGARRQSLTKSDADTVAAPNRFTDFLIDRAIRKPSEYTMKAYRQDFTAVGTLLTAGTGWRCRNADPSIPS